MFILSSLKFSAEALCFAARRAHLSTDHVAVLQLEAIQLCKGPGATGRSHKGPSKTCFFQMEIGRFMKTSKSILHHPASLALSRRHINATMDPLHISVWELFAARQGAEKTMATAKLLQAALPVEALLTSGRNQDVRLSISGVFYHSLY